MKALGQLVAKLNATQVFKWTGDLPENVNYAIKAGYLRALLGAREIRATAQAETPAAELSQLARRITGSVVVVLAK